MGLVMGVEGENSMPANMEIEDLQRRIHWTDRETTGEIGPGSADGPVISMGSPILRERR